MISVGIDIGQFSIKIAEVDDSSGTLEILKLEEFALSQDPNKDRKIEIVDILRTYISDSTHEQAQYVLSLPEWQVTTRKKFFPFKERHKILKSLPFELEDDIPMDHEDAIFDAKVNVYTENAAQVLAVAAPVGRVSEKVQLAKDIGIDLSVLSVDSMALANLVTRWDQPPPLSEEPESSAQMDDESHTEVTVVSPVREKLKMILAIGHTNTIALFFSKGVLKSLRSLDWGGEEMGQAVASSYKMHYVEALKEVQRKGFLLNSPEGASNDQVRFSDVLKSSLDDLARKLKLAVLETETETNSELESVYVTGGVSRLRNLCPYLTQQLEVAFNPFYYIEQFSYGSNEQNESIEPIVSQSLSLAVEGLRKPRNPAINLLKGPFAKEGQGFKPVWDKWGHTIQIGLTALIFLFVWNSFRASYSRSMADEAHLEMKALGQNVAGLSRRTAGSIASIQRFLRKQESIEKNRAAATKVKDINSAISVLDQISAALPANTSYPMDVKILNIERDTVTISGEVVGQTGINDIRDALKRIALGGKVTEQKSSSATSPSKRPFQFQFRVARTGGGM